MPNCEEPAELTELAGVDDKAHFTEQKLLRSEQQEPMNTTMASKFDERGSVNPTMLNITMEERISLQPSRFSINALRANQAQRPESYLTDPTRYKVKMPKSEVETFMSTMKVSNKDFAEFCVKLFHDRTLPPYLGVLRDHCKDQYETNLGLKQTSN